MLLSFIEIETARTLYGDVVFIGAIRLHDLNVSHMASEAMTLHGGTRNVTAERPFSTDRAFPVSARARMFVSPGRLSPTVRRALRS